MILNVCLQRAKKAGYFYKDASLVRVFRWNYYSSSSFGSMHMICGPPETSNFDRPCWSLVYYLNTCEGCGTRVIDTINGGMMEICIHLLLVMQFYFHRIHYMVELGS